MAKTGEKMVQNGIKCSKWPTMDKNSQQTKTTKKLPKQAKTYKNGPKHPKEKGEMAKKPKRSKFFQEFF